MCELVHFTTRFSMTGNRPKALIGPVQHSGYVAVVRISFRRI